MKRPALILLLPVLAATLGTLGCDKSPTAPTAAPPTPAPRTPIQATISRIDVEKFPAAKTDGSNWDASLIVSARRPDLYVMLTPITGASDFISPTRTDAQNNQVHAFSRWPSGDNLAAVIPYGNSRRVYVMDEDFGGDDDRVGWITVNLAAAYKGDEAGTFSHLFTDSGDRLSVRVYGTWGY
jgi:hypothetical protein